MSLRFSEFPTLRRLKSRRPHVFEECQNHRANTRHKSLALPTGTSFSIHIVREDGKRKQVPVKKSNSRPNTFVAFFDENKVNFEIDIDNKDSRERHLSLDLLINGKTYGFVIPKTSDATMETLETNGRKFHFAHEAPRNSMLNLAEKLSTLSRRGDASTANASVKQIRFKVQYSKIVPASVFEIFVKSPGRKIYSVEIFGEDCTEQLMLRLENIRGIDGTESLFFGGKQLLKDIPLGDQGIMEGSVVDVVLREDPKNPDSIPKYSAGALPDHVKMEDDLNSDSGFTPLQQEICKGGISEQQFFSKGFDADDSICIEPFIIELRRAPHCVIL